MRVFTFACLLILISLVCLIVVNVTTIVLAPPFSILAVAIGIGGTFMLLIDIYARINRNLNRLPKRPFYIIDTVHGRCLELEENGSYESCQRLLNYLAVTFGAEFSNHLDAGPRPHSDKDKGYWSIRLFDQDFFLMRQRGDGICIWGPRPPAEVSGFLRLAQHFNAIEYRTWQKRFLQSLCTPFVRTRSQVAKYQKGLTSRRSDSERGLAERSRAE